MNLYDLLGIKSSCTEEEFEKAKNRFYSTVKRYNNISHDWIEFVDRHCSLREKIGAVEYNKRLNMKDAIRKESGKNVDIFDDSLFTTQKFAKEELDKLDSELDYFNRKSKENTKRHTEQYIYDNKKTSKETKKYRLTRTKDKKQTKGLKETLKKIIIVAVAVGSMTVLFNSCIEPPKVPIDDETVVETTLEDKIDFNDEEKILIDYKVELGDTKIKIVNKLDLSDEEASKISENIFEGQVYKFFVSEDIAQEYNYNNKIIKTFLDTYELQSGGTLYEIASYVKDAYPEVFENMTIGEIKEQIAQDNGCTTQNYQAKTYVINCYKTQAELDKLIEMGVISSGMQF